MPGWNGNGVWQRAYSWSSDAAAGIAAQPSRFDTEWQYIASGFNNCLTRNGEGGPTANLPMAGFKYTGLGPGTAPGEAVEVGQLGGMISAPSLAAAQAVVVPAAIANIALSGPARGMLIEDTTCTDVDLAAHPLAIVKTANGRYFRRDDRNLWLEQFGAVGDWNGTTGTDNAPALKAAHAYLIRFGTSPAGITSIRSGATVQVGLGNFYFGSRINQKVSCRLIGRGSDIANQVGGTVFSFPDNTGIMLERYNTFNFVVVPVTTGSDGSYFEGITFAYVGTTPVSAWGQFKSFGVLVKARARFRDCCFVGFPGPGLYFLATAGAGGIGEGECSTSEVDSCYFLGGWMGVYIVGADANIITFRKCQFLGCSTWGVNETNGFLANHFEDCHFSNNGFGDALGSSIAVWGGNLYQIVPGQEVAASTTQPDTNASVWSLVGPATVYVTQRPAWTSGMLTKPGGPVYAGNANSSTTFKGCYNEQGGGNPVIMSPATSFGAGTTWYHAPCSTAANLGTSQGIMTSDRGWGRIGRFSDGTVYATASQYSVDPVGKTIILLEHGNFALSFYKLITDRVNMAVYEAVDNATATPIRYMTQAGTARTFGRNAGVAGVTEFGTLALGDGTCSGNARVFDMGAAPPSTGYHAVGEMRFNTAPTAAAGTMGWQCTTAGTPGVWTAR